MPPRAQPKVYQLLLKTYKLTIFLTAQPSTTVATLKNDALSALTAGVNQDTPGPPEVASVEDFEICKALKDKGRPTGAYEVLDVHRELRDTGLVNWEHIFLRFRDSSGQLLPVEYTQVSLHDDEDDQRPAMPAEDTSSRSKGKRKAHPE